MLRLVSLILFLAGVAFVGWGGYRIYSGDFGAQDEKAVVESQPFQTKSLRPMTWPPSR